MLQSAPIAHRFVNMFFKDKCAFFGKSNYNFLG
nr:MAG TPA: hypothetical protein [Caudoviricetes sp.]